MNQTDLAKTFEEILAAPEPGGTCGEVIGHSRDRRPITAYCFGKGSFRISLIAGCHADEPVGSQFLRHLVWFLSDLPENTPLLADHQWWVIPRANPDGAQANREWYSDGDNEINLASYLSLAKRELPGDDMEFGFPRDFRDVEARPENQSIVRWWQEAGGNYQLHVSLHGMGFAGGPWFLIDPAWVSRCEELKALCSQVVREMGYSLHDVDRRGEKGFQRLARGFCTRPNWKAMARYFEDLGDPTTAGKFRPSSMETIRKLGGDPLTLVTEMPLFILPKVGERLGPPDPEAGKWQERIQRWKEGLRSGSRRAEEVKGEASQLGLRAMPIRDQMKLQWALIAAGMEQVQLENCRRQTKE